MPAKRTRDDAWHGANCRSSVVRSRQIFATSSSEARPIGLGEVLDRVTMQVFVRDDCSMIATPVQRDVDGIPKGAHYARVSPMGIVHEPCVQAAGRISPLHEEFNRGTVAPISFTDSRLICRDALQVVTHNGAGWGAACDGLEAGTLERRDGASEDVARAARLGGVNGIGFQRRRTGFFCRFHGRAKLRRRIG